MMTKTTNRIHLGALAAAFLALLCLRSADAADKVYVCDPAIPSNCAKPDTSGNLAVTGSFSATLSGFAPNGSVATLAVTAASANVALPTGTVVTVTNTGANTAYVKLSIGAGTATTSDLAIVAGAAAGLTVGSNTFLNAITSSSTTTLSLAGGSGLVAGYGGGSSGGSGSNASVSTTGAAVPGSGTYAAMSVGGNLTGLTGTANGLKVDGSAVTQPVSAASLPLPTGAATSANQPSNAAQGSTTSGQTGPLVQGAVTTAAPTYTTAQTSPLSLDTTGALRVNVTAGGGTGGTSAAQGSTTAGQNLTPAGCQSTNGSPTYTGATTNMILCDGGGNLRVNVVAGAAGGTSYAQASTTAGQNVSPIGCRTLSGTPTDTTAQTNMVRCFTDGSAAVTVVNNGVAQGSTTSGQTMSPIGCATVSAIASNTAAQTNMPVCGLGGELKVGPQASAFGGATKFTLTAAASTNATNVKASSGTIYSVSVYNNSATPGYLTFYNTAGTPTCGTSIVWESMIPANSTSGAGAVENYPVGLDFGTGIGICVTTGIAGTGSVAASTYLINLGYK